MPVGHRQKKHMQGQDRALNIPLYQPLHCSVDMLRDARAVSHLGPRGRNQVLRLADQHKVKGSPDRRVLF